MGEGRTKTDGDNNEWRPNPAHHKDGKGRPPWESYWRRPEDPFLVDVSLPSTPFSFPTRLDLRLWRRRIYEQIQGSIPRIPGRQEESRQRILKKLAKDRMAWGRETCPAAHSCSCSQAGGWQATPVRALLGVLYQCRQGKGSAELLWQKYHPWVAYKVQNFPGSLRSGARTVRYRPSSEL